MDPVLHNKAVQSTHLQASVWGAEDIESYNYAYPNTQTNHP